MLERRGGGNRSRKVLEVCLDYIKNKEHETVDDETLLSMGKVIGIIDKVQSVYLAILFLTPLVVLAYFYFSSG